MKTISILIFVDDNDYDVKLENVLHMMKKIFNTPDELNELKLIEHIQNRHTVYVNSTRGSPDTHSPF